MQRGKSDLLPPVKATKKSLVFELSVRVAQRESSESANVLGRTHMARPMTVFST